MFLIPSHLRSALHSVLTASSTAGPHTALITSVQGQIYVSGSTYDPDWDESLECPDPAEQKEPEEGDSDEENEEEDVEPDLTMPEWRRTLRGMANREWKDHLDQGGRDTERLRLKCDVGKILFVPLQVPEPASASLDTSTTSPRSYAQADTDHMAGDNENPIAPDGERNGGAEEPTTQEKGRMLLILNGKQAVKWSVLDAKVRRVFSVDLWQRI
ncbi:hypothetical protein QFC22_003495 [Naganishia vaughanmartiniae]|uniref:Uncharacterized protein n=1 Tax=Naganishia vaughanmartiniae TaxID=1424756 RepID=A0ACC2X7H4_9TREE|nr:hypothetical protein QFC22_003495 [Naganishia vaughanmartiniae]